MVLARQKTSTKAASAEPSAFIRQFRNEILSKKLFSVKLYIGSLAIASCLTSVFPIKSRTNEKLRILPAEYDNWVTRYGGDLFGRLERNIFGSFCTSCASF
jgi:hypothetical protein